MANSDSSRSLFDQSVRLLGGVNVRTGASTRGEKFGMGWLDREVAPTIGGASPGGR